MGVGVTSVMPKKGSIPTGRAKSGRLWKSKQTERFSSVKRKGVLAHMAKSLEEKERIRTEKKAVQELENEMKEIKRQTKIEERQRREDKEKRKIANELKSSTYQNINPAKLKGMSKKQLRNIKKTTVNKHGQVELVSVYDKSK